MQRPRLDAILIPLLILMVVIVFTFAPTLRNEFVNWDDQTEIVENPDFNPVTWKGIAWNWSHTRLSLYMPITYMTWGAVAAMATRDAAGVLQPVGFHLLNLILHLLCSCLVFSLILQLWRRTWPALVGALVFAVHPLQVEPVAWASGMYTILSSGLSLAALIAYVAFVGLSEQRRTSTIETKNSSSYSPGRWKLDVEPWPAALFAIATFLYLLALLTKAASVSLPLTAGVIDVLILGRSIKEVWRSLWFWILLGLPIVLIAKHFQDVSQVSAPALWGRPVVALDGFGFYLRKIIWPTQLSPDYGRNPTWVMQHPLPVLFSIAIAILVMLVAGAMRKKFAWLAAGVGVLLAGVCPYLGLTTFDFQYVSTVADRYAYFGLIGLAIIGAGIAMRSRVAGAVAVVVVAAWALLSHQQVQRWQSTRRLFDYTLQVNEKSLVSHNVFGFIAAREHRPKEAEAHYLTALQIWPEDATIQYNLGNLYRLTNPKQAIERYRLAVKYQPRFPMYRNNLAAALARAGEAKEAYEQWQQAIELDPNYTDARNNLGDLLLNLGRTSEAADQYQQVLRIDPINAHASDRLRKLELPLGK